MEFHRDGVSVWGNNQQFSARRLAQRSQQTVIGRAVMLVEAISNRNHHLRFPDQGLSLGIGSADKCLPQTLRLVRHGCNDPVPRIICAGFTLVG